MESLGDRQNLAEGSGGMCNGAGLGFLYTVPFMSALCFLCPRLGEVPGLDLALTLREEPRWQGLRVTQSMGKHLPEVIMYNIPGIWEPLVTPGGVKGRRGL